MSKRDSVDVIVGGEPRIDFLPVEIKARKDAKRTRRFLLVLIAMVGVVCLGAYVFASNLTLQARVQLEQAQADTSDLLQQQSQFAEIRSLASKLEDSRNARLVASATEVLWNEYLRELQAKLPAGATVVAYTVDSQSALEAVVVPDGPLQSSKVATITLTVMVPNLAHVESLLVSLSSLTGYAGATVTTATLESSEDEALYSANVILNVNADAFAKRFFEPEESPAATTEAAPEGGGE